MDRKIESQIFQVIDEMEQYISDCKPKMFSSTEILVNRDTIDEYLRDLRRKAPEEIERYRKIIHNREAILDEARNTAQELINKAMEQTEEMTSQNEVMRRAYEQADEVIRMANEQGQAIVDQAAMEANALRKAGMDYMEDIMNYLENLLNNSSKGITSSYESLIQTLNTYSSKIQEDHKQLHPEAEAAASAAPQEAEPEINPPLEEA